MSSLTDPRERVQAARDELFAHLVASLGQHTAWLDSHLDDVRRDAKHRWTANLAATEAASVDATGQTQQVASVPIANLLKSPAKKRLQQQRPQSHASTVAQALFTSPLKQQQPSTLFSVPALESESVFGLPATKNNRPIRPVPQARSASQSSQASQSSLLSRSPGKVGGLNLAAALQHQQALQSLVNNKENSIQPAEQAPRHTKSSQEPPIAGPPRSNTQSVLSPSTGSGRHQQRASPRPPTRQQTAGPFSTVKTASPIKSPIKTTSVQPPIASPTPKPSRFAAAFSRLKQVASPSKHAYNATQKHAAEQIYPTSPSKHAASHQQRAVFGQPPSNPPTETKLKQEPERTSPATNLHDVFTALSGSSAAKALPAESRQFSDTVGDDLSDDDDNGEVEDILLGYTGRTPATGTAHKLMPSIPLTGPGDNRPASPTPNRPQTRAAAATASPKATSIPIPQAKASPPRPVRSPARPQTATAAVTSRSQLEESLAPPASPRPAPRNMSNLATIASVLAVPTSAIPVVPSATQSGSKSPRMSPRNDNSSIPRPASPRLKTTADPSSRPGSPALRASSRLAAKDCGRDSPRLNRPGSPVSNIPSPTIAAPRSPRLQTVLSSNLPAPNKPPPLNQASLKVPERQTSYDTSSASEGLSAISKVVTAPSSPIISPTESDIPLKSPPAAPRSPLRMQLKAQVEAKASASRYVDQAVPLAEADAHKRSLVSAAADAQTPTTASRLLSAPNTLRAPPLHGENKAQSGSAVIPPSPVFSSMLVGTQAGSSRTSGFAAAFAGKKSLGLGLGLGKSLGAGLGQSARPVTLTTDGVQSVVPRKRLSSANQDIDSVPTKAPKLDKDAMSAPAAGASTVAGHAISKDDDTRARLDMLRNRISIIKSSRTSSAAAPPIHGGVRMSVAHISVPSAAPNMGAEAVTRDDTVPLAQKPTIASSVAALLPASSLGTSFANFFSSSLAGLQAAATGATESDTFIPKTTGSHALVQSGDGRTEPDTIDVVSKLTSSKDVILHTSDDDSDVEEVLAAPLPGARDVISPARPHLARIVSTSSVHDIVNAYEAKSSAAIAEQQRQRSTSPIIIKSSPQNAKTVPPGFFGRTYPADNIGLHRSPSKTQVMTQVQRRSTTTTPPFSPPLQANRVPSFKFGSSPTHITVASVSPHKAATDEVALDVEDELDLDPIIPVTSEVSDNEEDPRSLSDAFDAGEPAIANIQSASQTDDLTRSKRSVQHLGSDVNEADGEDADTDQPPRKKHEADRFFTSNASALVDTTLKRSISASSFKPIRPQGLRPPSRAPSVANSNHPRASNASGVTHEMSKTTSVLKSSVSASLRIVNNDKLAGPKAANPPVRDAAMTQKPQVSAHKAAVASFAASGSIKGKATASAKSVATGKTDSAGVRKAPVVEIVVKSSVAKSAVAKTTVVRSNTTSNVQQSHSKGDSASNARPKLIAASGGSSSMASITKVGQTVTGHKATSTDVKASVQVPKAGQKAGVSAAALSKHEAAKAALAKVPAPALKKSTTSGKPGARAEPEGFELPDIDSEYSDSDEDEQARRAALRPGWTQSPILRQALATQASYNPDHLFGVIPTLQMEDIFKDSKSTLARLRLRTSSQHWTGTDALTAYEEQEYARRMGFRQHQQDAADS